MKEEKPNWWDICSKEYSDFKYTGYNNGFYDGAEYGYSSRDKEVAELKEAINSIVYNDDGVLKIGMHGDSEVHEIVYKALGITKKP